MQNAVDDVKVAALELSDKLWNQFWPLAWKVFMANVTNSITQLTNQCRQTRLAITVSAFDTASQGTATLQQQM